MSLIENAKTIGRVAATGQFLVNHPKIVGRHVIDLARNARSIASPFDLLGANLLDLTLDQLTRLKNNLNAAQMSGRGKEVEELKQGVVSAIYVKRFPNETHPDRKNYEVPDDDLANFVTDDDFAAL